MVDSLLVDFLDLRSRGSGSIPALSCTLVGSGCFNGALGYEYLDVIMEPASNPAGGKRFTQ